MAIDLDTVISKISKKEIIDDVSDFEVIDFYGGLDDIKQKRLKAVDKKLFLEDPLRFFRVMQFVGRFEMTPDRQLNFLCKNMKIVDTPLAGLLRVVLSPSTDARGTFTRWFCEQELANALAGRHIVQANHSRTEQIGTVRGLHYQVPPHAEMKLIRCI